MVFPIVVNWGYVQESLMSSMPGIGLGFDKPVKGNGGFNNGGRNCGGDCFTRQNLRQNSRNVNSIIPSEWGFGFGCFLDKHRHPEAGQ